MKYAATGFCVCGIGFGISKIYKPADDLGKPMAGVIVTGTSIMMLTILWDF